MDSNDGSSVTLNITAAARPIFDECARDLVRAHEEDAFQDNESNRQRHREAVELVAQLEPEGTVTFTTTKRVGFNVLDPAIEEGLERLGNTLDDRERRMISRFTEASDALVSLVAAYELVLPADEPQGAGAVS
jgi:hypothetical protein